MTVKTIRKRALAVAAAATLALGVAACGSGGGGGSTTSDGKTTMVWNMWSGSTAEVDAWNHLSQMVTAKHPDLALDFQTSSFNDYWTKLAAQASGGDAGCILGVQSYRAPSISQLLVPLDDMLAGAGIDGADFDPSIWKALQVDGQQLAVPYDFGPLLMFYNADRFREAGVPIPTTSWTVQDFLAAAQTLTSGGKHGFAVYPTIDSVTPWSLSLQGTGPLNAQGELDLTQEGFVKAVQWYADLVTQLKVAPPVVATNDATPALNSFIAGDAAMVVDGPWQLVNVMDQAQFEVGVAPIPAGDSGSHSQVAGSGFGISQTCPDPVPRRAGPGLPVTHRSAGVVVQPGARRRQGRPAGRDREWRAGARHRELHPGQPAVHAVRRGGGERPAERAGLPEHGAAAGGVTAS
jgi:multiple sugar transport system substrate-binding protein